MPKREIICADSLPWLDDHKSAGAVVTSLPDADEIPNMNVAQWQGWFLRAATLCMETASQDSVALFYQTDRKVAGELKSKANLLFIAAQETGLKLLWHKIVLRRGVNKIDLHRPGYTHLLAFSKSAKPGTATPDVIDRGKMIYPNAMGLTAAIFAVSFASKTNAKIIDPFCGKGTIPAVANALGFDSIGVDILSEQADAARKLVLKR